MDFNHSVLINYSHRAMITFTLDSENCHMYGSESCTFHLTNHFHFILSLNFSKKNFIDENRLGS